MRPRKVPTEVKGQIKARERNQSTIQKFRENAHHLTPRNGGYPFLLLTATHSIAGEEGPVDWCSEGR